MKLDALQRYAHLSEAGCEIISETYAIEKLMAERVTSVVDLRDKWLLIGVKVRHLRSIARAFQDALSRAFEAGKLQARYDMLRAA